MSLAINHLRLRLRPIQRALLAAARRNACDIDRLAKAEPVHIGTEQVARWLGGIDRALATGRLDGERPELTEDEEQAEAELRARGPLPLDAMIAAAELDRFEQDVLLVCAAVELDARFGSVLAFLQDDMQRRRPTVGLLAGLTTTFVAQLPERRRALGRLGRLRRYQLVRALPASLEIDEELVLCPHVLDALLGTRTLEPVDPFERTGTAPPLPASIDAERITRVADAMRGGTVAVVGVWGPARTGHDAVVRAIADRLRVRVRVPPALAEDPTRAIAEAAADARALGQLLWIDCDAVARHPDALEALVRATGPVCLTGTQPVRPSKLLAARSYVELELTTPSFAQRRDAWQLALPDLEPARAADLAARFRLGRDELAAIARTTEATLAIGDGERACAVEAVASQLVRRHGHQLARELPARRGAADLVLPHELHRQVLDIGRAFRVWPQLRDSWGLACGGGGLKALFTGEPGTGKTLAAEVIAHELGLPLVRIDLAQVVSKWVGETEKNLDTVFREAEDGNAVVFFDEAEALFGKRGEVQHGTDRYANLEVSFLLQRFEEHDGLVILASNLKGEIDDAFTRRFHAVLYFPRPAEAERRRLWRLALPPSLPVADDVDLALLARLELTGAGIVAAVRTAALRAAQSDAPRIAAADLVVGIARQFQRESRLLTARDLGRYGDHLRAADAS